MVRSEAHERKANMPRKSPVQGFTLVELLVVIGIITLLIAMLLPVISKFRAQSLFMMCKSRMRQQLQAHAAYGLDFKDAKPPLFCRSSVVPLQWISPDLKGNWHYIGQGILAGSGPRPYLTLETLLDPSDELAADAEYERRAWTREPWSGSSYPYFWQNPPDTPLLAGQPPPRATYEGERKKGHYALIMDLNVEQSPWRVWPCTPHPRIGRVNVGYLDGSVRDYAENDLRLQRPGGNRELIEWFRIAHELYRR